MAIGASEVAASANRLAMTTAAPPSSELRSHSRRFSMEFFPRKVERNLTLALVDRPFAASADLYTEDERMADTMLPNASLTNRLHRCNREPPLLPGVDLALQHYPDAHRPLSASRASHDSPDPYLPARRRCSVRFCHRVRRRGCHNPAVSDAAAVDAVDAHPGVGAGAHLSRADVHAHEDVLHQALHHRLGRLSRTHLRHRCGRTIDCQSRPGNP